MCLASGAGASLAGVLWGGHHASAVDQAPHPRFWGEEVPHQLWRDRGDCPLWTKHGATDQDKKADDGSFLSAGSLASVFKVQRNRTSRQRSWQEPLQTHIQVIWGEFCLQLSVNVLLVVYPAVIFLRIWKPSWQTCFFIPAVGPGQFFLQLTEVVRRSYCS